MTRCMCLGLVALIGVSAYLFAVLAIVDWLGG